MDKTLITVEVSVKADLEKVWKCWTNPADIMAWNHASDDWHCPAAVNNLKAGGSFNYRMAAKDGSFAFDFEGIYDQVIPHHLITYTLLDGRKVRIEFSEEGAVTDVKESFEAESENPAEMQQMGWQMILNNFKAHTEKQASS
ncbi:MAG: SRPBCC family protein [Bacteroidales bacterium]|nr:SRPBCC family protein [Bacteroidales bacterium]